MNSSNNLWCPLPWSHIAVKSNGYLRICSHSQSGGNKNTLLQKDNKLLRIDDIDSDVLNCDTLKDVRQQFLDNKWPDQCRRCKLEHEAGKRSRNNWEAELYDFTRQDAERITLPDGTVTEQRILSLDLRLGNKCNLQCVMCYPGESNQWYKIQEQITGSKVFKIDDQSYNVIDHPDFTWSDQTKYFNLLSQHAQFITRIKFGGGEPFLSKEHVELLEYLIENRLARRIELEYSINLTVFPKYMILSLQMFKKVKLCCSLDGIGEVNNAIRYPSTWESIEYHLEAIDKESPHSFTAFTSSTVSILNIEHFVAMLQWLTTKNFKKINVGNPNGFVSHPVMNPKYLNLRLMTADQQVRMFDYLKSQTTDSAILEKVEEWETYSKTLPMTELEILQGRRDLKEFFIKMSAIQNKDWKTIFPKCYEMIQEWNE